MYPIYDIIHIGEHYTVYMSGKLLALDSFPKEWINIKREHNHNTRRIKGEISELTDFSKISGGRHIYELIMEHIRNITTTST